MIACRQTPDAVGGVIFETVAPGQLLQTAVDDGEAKWIERSISGLAGDLDPFCFQFDTLGYNRLFDTAQGRDAGRSVDRMIY